MVLLTLITLSFFGTLLWLANVYYRFFVRSEVNFKGKYGEWALVTGATDGIGKAYAKHLAKRGINIVLVSRNEQRLKDTAKEISDKFGVETKIIALDLSKVSSDEIEASIKKVTAGIKIGILVNNAGISYDYPCYFDELPSERIDDLLYLNMNAVVYVTRALLPSMKENKQGCIINVSSSSGMIPTPLLTVYASTKAFVDFFSRGLHAEFAKDNIFVQAVMPSFVVSKLSKFSRPTYAIPTPDAYVSSSLKTVGFERCTTGYWFHEIQENLLLNLIPSVFYEKIRLNALMPMRKRALAKKSVSPTLGQK